MSVSLDRLQALRRQTGASKRLAPAVREVDALLDQVAKLRNLLRVKRTAGPTVPASTDRHLPGREIAPGLWLQEARVPLDTAWPTDLDGTFDRRCSIPSDDMLFFDTETTGLAGGTGTRAFMIGAGMVVPGGLHVRQLTITTMSAEAAMLEAFRAWLNPATTLVSYNGKSYDGPLLKTRYRLMRLAEPLSVLAHVDLLYPTRRAYRGLYENCRLATIERKVLGIVREDDLPGAEAPAAWLQYLRAGSAMNLRRVMDHNRQDLVSLARLTLHLSAHVRAEVEG